MAVMQIVTGPDNKILRTKSLEVKKIDRKVKKLIADLIDTLNYADGLGIAAPQIGVNVRIFIARLNFDTPQEAIVPVINPEILTMSNETEAGEEGCLSVPGRFGIVSRSRELIVSFTDIKGKKQILELSGLNARVIQHETDHINGKLFIDRMERELSSEELTILKSDKKDKVYGPFKTVKTVMNALKNDV